jgi:membrane associated rhomboid family serine protease
MNGFMQDLRYAFSSGGRVYVQLIIINVLVFLVVNVLSVTLMLLSLGGIATAITSQFELPAYLPNLLYRPWSILSYAFWHRMDIFHILFNILGLYWFGQILEEYLGGKRLISVYILSALFGGVLYILLYNFAPVPMWKAELQGASLAGASGAIYGIVLATATLLPTYTIFMFLIGPVQLKYVAAVFVVLSYLGLVSGNAGGNMAHLGGALVGYIFTIQLQKGNDLGAWIHNFADCIKSFFRPKPKMKTSYKSKDKEKATVNQPKAKNSSQAYQQNSPNETPNQEEIDALLDKISASGYDSLTKEEKQKLYKASKD